VRCFPCRALDAAELYGGDDLHLPLGAGLIDIPRCIRALQEIDYDGSITLEVFTPNREYLSYSRDVLHRVLGAPEAIRQRPFAILEKGSGVFSAPLTGGLLLFGVHRPVCRARKRLPTPFFYACRASSARTAFRY
jgi:hypothetical protein